MRRFFRDLTTPAWLAPVVIVGLVALVVALAPGRPAHAGGVTPHDYIGADACRACHVEQFDTWAKGPHAAAFDHLRDTQRKDKRCIQCHTMVPVDPDPALAGVQCEACHGAGRYYAKDNVMRDAELRSRLLFAVPDEKTCLRCHTDNASSLRKFSYAEALEKIRHWEDPPAEGEGEAAAEKAEKAEK